MGPHKKALSSDELDELVDTKAAMRILGFSKPDSVHQMVRRGDLPAERKGRGGRGGAYRFRVSDLLAVVAERERERNTLADARRIAERSRAAQGLPPFVENGTALQRVATVLLTGDIDE